MSYGLKDAQKSVSGALPGASTNADLGDIDLEKTADGDHVANCELLIEVPALTSSELPDDAAITANITTSDDDFDTEAVVANDVPLAVGADSAGAAASSARVRLPSNVKTGVRVNIANSGAGDPSGKNASAGLVF